MRQCGDCSLCCKVMGVPEVKQRHEWCPHAATPRGGCLIYEKRPQACRDFNCRWLVDERIGEHWYPARSKIVIDARINDGKMAVCFIVDPAYPGRWREDPWFSDIKKIARTGLREGWLTVIMIKDEIIPIGK